LKDIEAAPSPERGSLGAGFLRKGGVMAETADSTAKAVRSDIQQNRGVPLRETFSTDTARQMYNAERAYQEKQQSGKT
jgi:hypothetical protein